MDSFRKVLGLGSKSPRPSTTQPPQPTEKVEQVQQLSSHNVSEDDIFSDMLINAPAPSQPNPSRNISDIQDLDIDFKCTASAAKDDGTDAISRTDDGPSAFGFMNVEPFQGTDAVDHDSSSLAESSCHSATEEETHSDASSNFSFIKDDISAVTTANQQEDAASRGSTPTAPRAKNTRKMKRLSTKPGFGNVTTDTSKKSPSSQKKRSIEDTEHPTTSDDRSLHTASTEETSEASAATATPERKSPAVVSTTPTASPSSTTTTSTAKSIPDSEDEGHSQPLNEDEAVETPLSTSNQEKETDMINTIPYPQVTEKVEEEEEDIFADLKCNSSSNNTNLSNVDDEESLSEDTHNNGEDDTIGGTADCPIKEGDNKQDNDVCDYHQPQLESIEKDSDRYDIKITGEDKVMLQLQRLQQEEQIYKKEKSEALVEQRKLIDEWIQDHMSEDQIRGKILELRETQSLLERKEDYDAAADIDRTIGDLNEKCQKYKYQHPLRDERFLHLLRKYEEQCNKHNIQYERMLKENEELISWFRAKTLEEEGEEEKRLTEATLVLKENKLKLERELSHTSLDNQHIVKNRCLLQEEIGKQTEHLNAEKEELVVKRTGVQAEIEQLLEKLSQLQSEEQHLTSLIVGIEGEIGDIEEGFQPRIDQLSLEEEAVREKEEKLKTNLEDIMSEETRIQNRNMDIVNQRKKTEEMIGQITSSMDEIRTDMNENSQEMFTYEDLVDFGGLVEDTDYMQCKNKYDELQTSITQSTNKLVANEAKQKRLRRTLSDLEAQLAELDKLKQAHVQERKYKDAKVTTEEIKSLRSKGENLSSEEMQLSDSIKSEQLELKELKAELAKVEEEYRIKEELHERKIKENLEEMNGMVDGLITGLPHSWTYAILELTLVNNKNIIDSLSKKHGWDSNREDNDNDVACHEEFDSTQALQEEIDELERNLKVSEAEEDWERAEEIDNIIQAKKKQLETAT